MNRGNDPGTKRALEIGKFNYRDGRPFGPLGRRGTQVDLDRILDFLVKRRFRWAGRPLRLSVLLNNLGIFLKIIAYRLLQFLRAGFTGAEPESQKQNQRRLEEKV